MLCKIHAIVEYSPNFDSTIVAGSIQQEVTGAMDSVAGRRYAVSAVPEMVGPCSRGDLGTGLAAGAPRIISHIEDGANQECLIA
jgi:hypothetical protein